MNKGHTCRYKNYSEEYSHKDTDQQYSTVIFFFDLEGRKDKYENKNIIDTETPFHQVTTDIFKCSLLPTFYPDINEECQGQCYPKESLPQRLPDSNGFILLAKQPQVEYKGQY